MSKLNLYRHFQHNRTYHGRNGVPIQDPIPASSSRRTPRRRSSEQQEEAAACEDAPPATMPLESTMIWCVSPSPPSLLPPGGRLSASADDSRRLGRDPHEVGVQSDPTLLLTLMRCVVATGGQPGQLRVDAQRRLHPLAPGGPARRREPALRDQDAVQPREHGRRARHGWQEVRSARQAPFSAPVGRSASVGPSASLCRRYRRLVLDVCAMLTRSRCVVAASKCWRRPRTTWARC